MKQDKRLWPLYKDWARKNLRAEDGGELTNRRLNQLRPRCYVSLVEGQWKINPDKAVDPRKPVGYQPSRKKRRK